MSMDSDFDVLLSAHGDKPVILFFGSESCGPTLAMFDVLDEFDAATQDNFARIALSVDNAPHTTRRFGVKATPWMLLMRSGEPLAAMQGTMSAEQMIEWAQTALLPKSEKKARAKKAA